MDEQPLNAGILDLATHGRCGTQYRYRARWALTPPFHPYLPMEAGGSFLSPLPRPFGRLPEGSMVPCVARTFLTSYTGRTRDELSAPEAYMFIS